jgi:very-short-patch-repair endonuclease
MACGSGAVLSYRDGAQLWELRQSNSWLIDVTVPSRAGRTKRRGVRVHRSGRLAAEEVTVRQEPDCGVWIEGYELDFVWTRANLAVELDGIAAHGTRRAINVDRLRDRRLWRAGIRTMRLTSEALDDVQAVLFDLAQAGVRVASWPRASS